MLRYWDGTGWTEHRAPIGGQQRSPAPVDQGSSTRGEMKWAWALAVTPAIFLLMDTLVWLFLDPGEGLDAAVGGAAFGLVVALVFQDSKALAEAGVRVSRWWGILLLPVYLVLRTVRARSSVGVPLLWFGLMAGYVVGSIALYAVAPGSASASAPAGSAPSAAATPTPAPFSPTASIQQLGGASVRVECMAHGPYGDDYYSFGRYFRDAWYVLSNDCKVETSGHPGKRERRALRTAFPTDPVDARNLAPLYRICSENDPRWLEELAGPRVTADMVSMVEGALVLCPKHPKRERADRLIAEADIGGPTV